MACTVEHRRFLCTTSDVIFGPLFESDDEGEAFRTWMYRNYDDPRRFSHDELETMLSNFRAGQSNTEGK